MLGCGQSAPDQVEIPTQEDRILTAKLILEEWFEYCESAGITVLVDGLEQKDQSNFFFSASDDVDLVAMADSGGDLEVVVKRIFVNSGLDSEPITDAICENNLSKLIDGFKCPKTGKWMKGKNYSSLDLTELVEQQKNPTPKASFEGGPQHTSLG